MTLWLDEHKNPNLLSTALINRSKGMEGGIFHCAAFETASWSYILVGGFQWSSLVLSQGVFERVNYPHVLDEVFPLSSSVHM